MFIGALVFSACATEDGPEIKVITSGVIETYAGLGPQGFGYSGDGNHAATAQLGFITGIATDNDGNVYVSDGASNTVRKINAGDRVINTVAGVFVGFNVIDPTPFAGDGGMAIHAHLNIPQGIAIDNSGNLFIADAGNSLVRKVSFDEKISTFAGKVNTQGFTGDDGPAISASIWNPFDVDTDAVGNVYISDSQNNAIRKIEKSTGTIVTIAGSGASGGGYSGDSGPSTLARLNNPQGIAVAANGDVYIADSGNNVIRKISSGIITTLAGAGTPGFTGDGGPAREATFSVLKGLALDSEGNLYIADSGNNVIRMIERSSGKIATFAGSGTAGYSGDLGIATEARLSNPVGVTVDADGNIFIADAGNFVIRKVTK